MKLLTRIVTGRNEHGVTELDNLVVLQVKSKKAGAIAEQAWQKRGRKHDYHGSLLVYINDQVSAVVEY